MLYLLLFVALMLLCVIAFLNMPMFGKLPTGERLKRIQQSPNYKNGRFSNLSHTADLTEGATYLSVLKDFLFPGTAHLRPKNNLPTVKTNLHNLPVHEDVLVWFGHSSYFMQLSGKTILVDPVLSGSASPLPGGTKAFNGADVYSAADMPEIDFLFITHDHWDHLDYETMLALKPKIKNIICPLGVGAHFEYWGFETGTLHEKDWGEQVNLGNGFLVTLTSARHFAGRTFKRNKALWTSFVLQTPSQKIFIGGDSGYDSHFAAIGREHGPFQLAILENGQYNKSWKHIHLMPGEIYQAAQDLRADRILPVHSAKFKLSTHAWYEPLQNVWQQHKEHGVALLTPMIGELVQLNNSQQTFTPWWQGIH